MPQWIDRLNCTTKIHSLRIVLTHSLKSPQITRITLRLYYDFAQNLY